MKGRRLLRNFSLGCLILSLLFGVFDFFVPKASLGSTLVLLFVGLLGTFTNISLIDLEKRLELLEKGRAGGE